MDGYVKVARSEEIKERFAISVTVNGKSIAIFKYNQKLYALRDSCPHQAAPISDGYVDEGFVVCPHHGWMFKLEDGSFSHNDLMKIPVYPVKEEDGAVYINPNANE
ncbi:MAG: nitrite reductase small subunit NirD [Calditrichaceae bacterium]|jgi:nitrite reductase (NADH) small subunit